MLLRETLYKIEFYDIETDYTKFSPEEAKIYIFAMSEGYRYYLDYLKKYQGEEEFRKEMRTNDMFLKKIEPLKNRKYEKELKEKFEKTMSEMMDARLNSSEIEKLLLL